MDRNEAAQALGLATADVVDVEDVEHGTEVEVRGAGRRLITGDGVYRLDDHPGSAHLRTWEAPVEVAEEAEPVKAPAKPRTRTRKA